VIILHESFQQNSFFTYYYTVTGTFCQDDGDKIAKVVFSKGGGNNSISRILYKKPPADAGGF
jgi:hypothetical protein